MPMPMPQGMLASCELIRFSLCWFLHFVWGLHEVLGDAFFFSSVPMWMSVNVVLYGVLFVYFRTSNKHYVQYTHEKFNQQTHTYKRIPEISVLQQHVFRLSYLFVSMFPSSLFLYWFALCIYFCDLEKEKTKWNANKKKKITDTKPYARTAFSRARFPFNTLAACNLVIFIIFLCKCLHIFYTIHFGSISLFASTSVCASLS